MEDLGLKIADNQEQAFWIKVKKEAETRIESMEREIIINQAIIGLSEEKIKENEE